MYHKAKERESHGRTVLDFAIQTLDDYAEVLQIQKVSGQDTTKLYPKVPIFGIFTSNCKSR